MRDENERIIEIISQMTEDEKYYLFKSIGLKPDVEKIFNLNKKKKDKKIFKKKLVRKN